MARRAEPKKDIEYKFRFHKNGVTHSVVLIFENINEKGRLVFLNKKSGAFTSMTPERFGYIHRFNLMSEKPIQKQPSQIEIQQEKQRQEAIRRRVEEERLKRKAKKEEKEEIDDYIERLRTLNKDKQSEVEFCVGRLVKDIIASLSCGHWDYTTASEWYKIKDIVYA